MIADAELADWGDQQGLTPPQAHRAALEAGVFPECWERNFPTLTTADQLRLLSKAVLVAGLGGLGGCHALLLARTGVGRLILADGDAFAPSNLNRQLLATRETLGRSKASVTAAYLGQINPALVMEPVTAFLTPENLPRLVTAVEVVLDGLDNFPARRHLFQAAARAGKPVVHGAVWGSFGQVSTLLAEDTDVLEILIPKGSKTGDPPGAVATGVTLIASLQVQEAVRLLLEQPPAYRRRLAHFDGDTGRLEILPL